MASTNTDPTSAQGKNDDENSPEEVAKKKVIKEASFVRRTVNKFLPQQTNDKPPPLQQGFDLHNR